MGRRWRRQVRMQLVLWNTDQLKYLCSVPMKYLCSAPMKYPCLDQLRYPCFGRWRHLVGIARFQTDSLRSCLPPAFFPWTSSCRRTPRACTGTTWEQRPCGTWSRRRAWCWSGSGREPSGWTCPRTTSRRRCTWKVSLLKTRKKFGQKTNILAWMTLPMILMLIFCKLQYGNLESNRLSYLCVLFNLS